jgi:hypothetical protein
LTNPLLPPRDFILGKNNPGSKVRNIWFLVSSRSLKMREKYTN